MATVATQKDAGQMTAVELAGGDATLLFSSRNQIDFIADNETGHESKAESTVFLSRLG